MTSEYIQLSPSVMEFLIAGDVIYWKNKENQIVEVTWIKYDGSTTFSNSTNIHIKRGSEEITVPREEFTSKRNFYQRRDMAKFTVLRIAKKNWNEFVQLYPMFNNSIQVGKRVLWTHEGDGGRPEYDEVTIIGGPNGDKIKVETSQRREINARLVDLVVNPSNDAFKEMFAYMLENYK